MKRLARVVAALALPACLGAATEEAAEREEWGSADSAWIATRRWSPAMEDAFAGWVGALGAARARRACSTLESCLRKPEANTLWSAEDEELDLFADCADLPYVVRAYFSYKMRLPFSFASEISGGRYTSGNEVVSRSSFLDFGSLGSLIRGLSESVHSGFYRTAPGVEDADLYPVEISRQTIRPGAVYYDPNGHVLMVYALEDDGTVRLIDGHPDNSLTVQRFGEAFARGTASQGGGFRQWRPQWIESTGRFALERNEGCDGFHATSQYAASYDVGGQSVGYHAWVRASLSLAGSRVRPDAELGEQLTALCGAAQDRVAAVDAAIADGVHRSTHPWALPRNIYGTDGEWEVYSTPSRDARLKAQAREAHRFVEESIARLERGDESLDFEGSRAQLVQAYRDSWASAVQSCALSYRRTDGTSVALTLDDLMDRLFALSFDPYHCPELRWGATDAAELGTCSDGPGKLVWYRGEQRLRNAIDRDYDARTTLDWGPTETPDVHLPRLLERL